MRVCIKHVAVGEIRCNSSFRQACQCGTDPDQPLTLMSGKSPAQQDGGLQPSCLGLRWDVSEPNQAES